MNYITTIKSALSSLSVPVSFMRYGGKETLYVTFFCYNRQGERYAENVEIATGYYVQIDIWSLVEDNETLANQIETALKAVGFIGRTDADLYETDTKIYHKAIRMNCIVEN